MGCGEWKAVFLSIAFQFVKGLALYSSELVEENLARVMSKVIQND